MRKLLLAVPLFLACGGAEETPPADEPAAAMAPALTEADVAGTWTGTGMIAGTDSVFTHWTQVCAAGTCRGTSTETPNDTIVSTYVIDADSSVGTAGPVPEPTMGGVMVMDRWVARISNGMVNGTGTITLADRPDSVVMRYTFSGTKTP
jgi:hypothetical protein